MPLVETALKTLEIDLINKCIQTADRCRTPLERRDVFSTGSHSGKSIANDQAIPSVMKSVDVMMEQASELLY